MSVILYPILRATLIECDFFLLEAEEIFINASHGSSWQLEGGWNFGRQEPS